MDVLQPGTTGALGTILAWLTSVITPLGLVLGPSGPFSPIVSLHSGSQQWALQVGWKGVGRAAMQRLCPCPWAPLPRSLGMD